MSKLGQTLAIIALTPVVTIGSLIGSCYLLSALTSPRPAADATVNASISKSTSEVPLVEAMETPMSETVILQDKIAGDDTANDLPVERATDASTEALPVADDSELSASVPDATDTDDVLLNLFAASLYDSYKSELGDNCEVYVDNGAIHLVMWNDWLDAFFLHSENYDPDVWIKTKSDFVNIERELYQSMIEHGVNAQLYLSLLFDGDINYPLLSIYDDGIVIIDEIGSLLSNSAYAPGSQPVPENLDASASRNGDATLFDTYNFTERSDTSYSFIVNTDSKIIHSPDCKFVPKISPENYAETNDPSEFIESDPEYRGCMLCNPTSKGRTGRK